MERTDVRCYEAQGSAPGIGRLVVDHGFLVFHGGGDSTGLWRAGTGPTARRAKRGKSSSGKLVDRLRQESGKVDPPSLGYGETSRRDAGSRVERREGDFEGGGLGTGERCEGIKAVFAKVFLAPGLIRRPVSFIDSI